jgi:hypothetical protein
MTKRFPSKQQAIEAAKRLIKPGTPQDVTSVRAKNAGHKKKTADKWNQ